MDDVISKLKDLGLNSYEAKVYMALLKNSPATGYEVSQNANIPQSRAYDALKSLVNEKIVFTTDEKPQKYSPITPKELTGRYKRKMASTLDYLEKKLPATKQLPNEPIHYISDYDSIMEKIKEVIKNAKRSIYLEIYNKDFKNIENEIIKAYDNNVDIKIVGYGPINIPYGMVYQHNGAKEIENNPSKRLIFVLADSTECIFGTVESEVIWTKNNYISFLLKEFIVHDMYLLDVSERFPEQLRYFYGADFRRLKEKILSSDSSFNIH